MKGRATRAARRALWAEANRTRTPGSPRLAWGASFLPSPLQAHALAKRRAAGGQSTLEIALGFNRAQRRAMHSKKGPRRLLEHGRPTSTPAQSFLPGKGTWNRHALRIEGHRRLRARVAEHRRRNVWWRRALRLARILPVVPLWWARAFYLRTARRVKGWLGR